MRTREEYAKMRRCVSLLPHPGPEVVTGLLDDIDVLLEAAEALRELLDELDTGREAGPQQDRGKAVLEKLK